MAAAVPEVDAIRIALGNIGFNQATINVVVEQGVETYDSLCQLTGTQIDDMVKFVMRNAPPAGVSFPFIPVQRFKAFRYYVDERIRCGLPPDANAFDVNMANTVLQEMREAKQVIESLKGLSPQKPKPLKNLGNWYLWKETLLTYLGQVVGASHCTLDFLCRDHIEPTDEMVDAPYVTVNDRLKALTLFEGSHVEIDNMNVFDILKEAVIDGPGWSFIQRHDKDRNGRKAYLQLKQQCEGAASEIVRKKKAYGMIALAEYKGHQKNYPFSSYVTQHQKAHNELLDCGEPIPESKKVTDFLNGITDPTMHAAIVFINGDMTKLNDFDACQQYLSSLVANTATQKASSRNRRSVASTNTKGKGAKGGRGSPSKKVIDKYYSDAEWKKLSKEYQDKVLELREKKGKETCRTRTRDGGMNLQERPAQRQRQAQEINRDDERNADQDGGAEEAPPAAPDNGNRGGQAGNQFGRNAMRT